MVDLHWKSKMPSSDISPKSPKPTNNKPQISIPSTISPLHFADISPASSSSCAAYEQYVRLPELLQLWSSKDFPDWKNEGLIKPALQGLEITFRFISVTLSDPRPYSNRREWTRRLESLATSQIQLVSLLCEDDSEDPETRGKAPIVDLTSSSGVLGRRESSLVWKAPGGSAEIVSKTSDASLLPRLATWQKSEDVASKVMFAVECEMRRCPYTLGLGEPNLSGKPSLQYDQIVKPAELHLLKKNNTDHKNLQNHENQYLFTIHQILESWIHATRELIKRVEARIDSWEYEKAASDCWILERIWNLLVEIEDLHLLMDPNDFLKLKNQLAIQASSEREAFCFRSKGLIEITNSSKELKHKVPAILNVKVDPKGGPRIQEAAMKLYQSHSEEDATKVHLLQAFQAVESALKKFFFSYRHLIGVVMGSLEAGGGKNRSVGEANTDDVLFQIYSEPTYFPSLDGAKTFLGDNWHYECGKSKSKVRTKKY